MTEENHEGKEVQGAEISDNSEMPTEEIAASDGTEVSDLARELEKEKAAAAEFKDKYIRLLAEFDNFKKHAAKQRSELLKYQGQPLVSDLLAVIDNFDLSMGHKEAGDSFRQGMEMIHKNFIEILGKWGIKGESSVGKQFDPAMHSAISSMESDEHKPGTVIRELKKAYFYKDKMLRPADVVVAAEKIQPSENEGKEEENSGSDAESVVQ